MTGRPTAIETVDANRDMIRFKIYSNKNDDGTIHILQKHYKTNIGYVSAIEIVNGIEDSGRERLYPEIILFRQIKNVSMTAVSHP